MYHVVAEVEAGEAAVLRLQRRPQRLAGHFGVSESTLSWPFDILDRRSCRRASEPHGPGPPGAVRRP
jgi:hypothetical protein